MTITILILYAVFSVLTAVGIVKEWDRSIVAGLGMWNGVLTIPVVLIVSSWL